MPNTTDALIKMVTSDYLSFPVERVHVDTLDEKSFLLRYVVTRRPVILIGAVDHWKAIKLWSDPSLSGFNRMTSLCRDSITSLQCTPDGRGDCVKDGLFVKPMDRRLRFSDALERINAARDNITRLCEIPYLSGQDDCLRKELPGLLADLGGDASIRIATSALGGALGIEAINMWVGLSGSVSTLHKDNYDNLMTVITGCKRFLLLPPSDILFLQEEECEQARYIHNDNDCKGCNLKDGETELSCWSIQVEHESGKVPWISVDPENPDLNKFPSFASASPVIADVNKGETLFLPALWLHQVSHPKNEITIAVNSWRDYDMMSSTYVSHEILTHLKKERFKG